MICFCLLVSLPGCPGLFGHAVPAFLSSVAGVSDDSICSPRQEPDCQAAVASLLIMDIVFRNLFSRGALYLMFEVEGPGSR